MSCNVVDLLRQLVAIPSVNPMGRDAGGTGFFETALTDHLERLLREIGLDTWRQTVSPGRDNLVARLDGTVPPEDGGPLILFDAHQDTVPADNMTIAPFAGEVRGGRLYGRGACDVKGGLAATIAALARLAAVPRRPTVLLTCTVDEEYRFTGIRALTEAGLAGPGRPMPRMPDAAIVAEPTGLDVVVGHKGIIRWQCHTDGRAAHGSTPEAGQNAIYAMAHVLTALEHYQRHVVAGLARHPGLGGCTLNAGIIRGGSSVNIVPDLCTIEVESRFPPGITPDAARRHVIDYLSGPAETGVAVRHDPPYMQGPALPDDRNRGLAERLASASREVHGRSELRLVPYCTNASYFAAAGVPAVVFGPGSVEQAHTKDEWIDVDELHQAVDVLVRFAAMSAGW